MEEPCEGMLASNGGRPPDAYARAGVDIAAGNAAVARYRDVLGAWRHPEDENEAVRRRILPIEIGGADPEHFTVRLSGVEPEQRQLRKCRLQQPAATADLAE